MKVQQNSDFLFGFEANMTNPNGDPDQENKPRMDYETATALVSDARRKRDCREFLKQKGYRIFVDTLADKKVPMEKMFTAIMDEWLHDQQKFKRLLDENVDLREKWNILIDADGSGDVNYLEEYRNAIIRKKSDKNRKSDISNYNTTFLTLLIKKSLIDVRLFGSAMAIEGITRTYTGPVQVTWGYSLHPVELVKSNTITSIMNEDNSTFGKKHRLYYALIMHYGTINKYSAKITGMKEDDRMLFRKALVQGMMSNQTDSKQGQTPLFYLEILYKTQFDGYLGDLRRFLDVSCKDNERPIRQLHDLKVDFQLLSEVIKKMKSKDLIDKVIGWFHPLNMQNLKNLPPVEVIDLWAPVSTLQEG